MLAMRRNAKFTSLHAISYSGNMIGYMKIMRPLELLAHGEPHSSGRYGTFPPALRCHPEPSSTTTFIHPTVHQYRRLTAIRKRNLFQKQAKILILVLVQLLGHSDIGLPSHHPRHAASKPLKTTVVCCASHAAWLRPLAETGLYIS
jgi:hypothetical protein